MIPIFRQIVILALFAGSLCANSYQIEEVTLAPAMVAEISGVAFTPGGSLVVVNRHGEVWITTDPSKAKLWKRFAFGLHEPLGVLALSENEILVTQRPELTRLRDTTGDGIADHYETLNDDWSVTDNWHEFTYGLRRDSEGNFLISTGLPDMAGSINTRYPRVALNMENVHQERKPSPGRYEGWVLRIDADGKMTPVACGFRSPAGIGLSPDGDLFITDQQGDYIATSTLVHVQADHFYGHPASLKWRDDYRGPIKDLATLAAMRTPEAVALPHGALGGSPGEPVWDTTGGKFGPFGGQIFIGDFTKLISRVYLEKIAGEYQGVAFPFIRDAVGLAAIQANSGSDNLTIPAGGEGLKHFRDVPPRSGTPLRPGNMRMAFAPDGSLYVGQTTRGWGKGDGLQRVVWSGKTPVEMEKVQLSETGFRITFTEAMNLKQVSDPKAWRVSRFRYLYLPAGSPRADESSCPPTAIQVSADGRSVELSIDTLEPGYIYEIEPDGLQSISGAALENPLAFYTLNRLLDGREFNGPLSEPLLIDQDKPRHGPDPEAGRLVYATFCVICHQADGSGGGLPGTPEFAAANFRQRGPDSPLAKTDQQLLDIITNGAEGKPMPPFSGVLKAEQIDDVLAYLRIGFGEAATSESMKPKP